MENKMDSKFDTDGWEITANRFVAYIDIMGFKDLVARNNHNVIYEMMKRIDSEKKIIENVKWGDSDSSLIRTTTYSDSIMVYSKDDSENSMHSLVCTASTLSNSLFVEKVPHKGAIAFGTMTFDKLNAIYFGQPLIDAYLLQEELYYYGIIVHATAEEKLDNRKKITPFTSKYLCPLKNGYSTHTTVYPATANLGKSEKYKKDKIELFESIKLLRYKTSGYLRKYIDNTEKYLIEIENAK